MFYLALLLGLTSSLHCVGMCGPIVLALPVHHRSTPGKIAGILLYNAGRILVYALLGLAAGGLGFVAGDWQNWLSVGAGILLVLFAIGTGGALDQITSGSFFQRKMAELGAGIRKRLNNRSFLSLAVMGTLNGLLPCGMIYLALLSALAMPDSFSGALYMGMYGLGTLPAMFLTAFMGQWASVQWRKTFKKATPYLVAFAGIVLIVRGLSPVTGHIHHAEASRPIPICVGK